MDTINVCFWKLKRDNPLLSDKELVKDSFVDVSQCVSRLRVRRNEIPTYTTSTLLYSYGKDTLLSGATHLRMLGWPAQNMPAARFEDGLLRDLGGDAFSVPICTLVHGACALNPKAVWWRRPRSVGVAAGAGAARKRPAGVQAWRRGALWPARDLAAGYSAPSAPWR